MKKLKLDRRSGVERGEFLYTVYSPERRCGYDRRIEKNGKEVIWAKRGNKIENYNKVWLKRNQFLRQIILAFFKYFGQRYLPSHKLSIF
jgi:hypothetical protein